MTGRRRYGSARPSVVSNAGTTIVCVTKMPVYLRPVQPARQVVLPRSRAHGLLSHLLILLMVAYRRREHTLRAWFPSAGIHVRRREPALRALFPSFMVLTRQRERALPTLFPSAVVQHWQRGPALQATDPPFGVREPALHAPLLPVTRQAALRMLLLRDAINFCVVLFCQRPAVVGIIQPRVRGALHSQNNRIMARPRLP